MKVIADLLKLGIAWDRQRQMAQMLTSAENSCLDNYDLAALDADGDGVVTKSEFLARMLVKMDLASQEDVQEVNDVYTELFGVDAGEQEAVDLAKKRSKLFGANDENLQVHGNFLMDMAATCSQATQARETQGDHTTASSHSQADKHTMSSLCAHTDSRSDLVSQQAKMMRVKSSDAL